MRRLACFLSLCVLAGCVSPPTVSQADAIPPQDAAFIADVMVKVFGKGLGEAQTVYFAPVSQASEISRRVTQGMQAAGFTLSAQPGPGIPTARYQVGAYGMNAILMRLQIESEEVVTTFTRMPEGYLRIDLPFSVRSSDP